MKKSQLLAQKLYTSVPEGETVMKQNGNKARVVVIETDPTYLKMWEKILNSVKDCDFMITNDIKAAVNVIKTQKVDLLVCEAILPSKDGYEIARLTHKHNPNAEILLTTAYDCDLSRFNIKDPHFNILYKPYANIDDIQKFIGHLAHHEDACSDASEDSFSENDEYPQVLEWKL